MLTGTNGTLMIGSTGSLLALKTRAVIVVAIIVAAVVLTIIATRLKIIALVLVFCSRN